MPIIVDEVVISVEVTNAASGGAGVGAGSGGAGSGGAGAGAASGDVTSSSAPLGDKHALIAECVERVLDILRQREER